jgi:hypothetical protein
MFEGLVRGHAVAAAVAEVCAKLESPLLLVVLQPALQETEPACSNLLILLDTLIVHGDRYVKLDQHSGNERSCW